MPKKKKSYAAEKSSDLPSPEMKGDSYSKADKVLNEIVGKLEDFENGMASFMQSVGEWGDLYKIRKPVKRERAFSNPRLTEFFRACNALSTLLYRMMTAKDPYYSMFPVDMDADYAGLDVLNAVFRTQLKYGKHKPNLLKACSYLVPFGTVIVQEDYRIIGVSPFGRRIPTTVFIPRVMDQVCFDRSTTDIDEADWISTSDITSSHALMRLAEESKLIGTSWNAKALEVASNEPTSASTVNDRVISRLSRDVLSGDESGFAKKKELVMYYGKLDCLNDGVEYVVAAVNRRHLVRFHANRFQHGKRQFRIAKWIDFDNPLGIGLGQILSPLHRSMDSNRQRTQDNIAMAAMNMWKRKKNSVSDDNLVIRPLNVVDVEEDGDITALSVPVDGALAALKLEEILKQEFRAASGATDTLQALITDATASEVSLAQNEAMRNISVKAEQIAEPLVREHLEILHWNNVQNIKEPFNVNKAGLSHRIYPADLQVDLDFETRVTTDKDFKPQRLEKLIQLVTTLTSTKSQHPDQIQISILPLVKEIAYMLDVNPQDVIMRPGSAPISPLLGAGDLSGLGSPGGVPPGPSTVASTPVGDTLISPQ